MIDARLWRRPGVGFAAGGLLTLLLPASAWADSDTYDRDRHINDRFGSSVAIVGDELLIGASGDNSEAFNGGAVYIFDDDKDGTLIAQDKLYPKELRGQEWFGTAMASDGERLIVGGVEPYVLGHPTRPSKRAAWIFRRQEGAWSQEGELHHDDDAVLADRFGSTVAISGDHAAVLASAVQVGYGYADHRIDVFARGDDGWHFEARILPGAGQAVGDLVLAGDHLLVAQSGGLAAYLGGGGSWEPEDTPDVGRVDDLAVLQTDPPRVAAVDIMQVSILRHEGGWAVEGTLELPARAIDSQQSIAGTGDLLVALCDAVGEEQVALQAVSYRLQDGAWVSIGEPMLHEFYGARRGSVAISEGRLAVAHPHYPRPDDKFTNEGQVSVYAATADGWQLADELIPGPTVGGCRIDRHGGGPALLLLALLALASRRRRP